MINERIAIVGLTEVNSNRSSIPTKENIYDRKDGWFKTRKISTGYNRFATSDGLFQSRGTYMMAMDDISCRTIATREPGLLVMDTDARK